MFIWKHKEQPTTVSFTAQSTVSHSQKGWYVGRVYSSNLSPNKCNNHQHEQASLTSNDDTLNAELIVLYKLIYDCL